MNKFISDKKTILAIVFSVAIISTLGTLMTANAQSENSTQGTIINMPVIQGTIDINKILMSNVKTSFVDAANTAASTIAEGKVVGGELGPDQGYYVYNFRVLDGSSKMHFVTVDAGNNKVLSNTEGFGLSVSAPGNVIYKSIGPMSGFSEGIMMQGQSTSMQDLTPQK
jgi:uncharacterized membrane protein YkoI